MPGLIQGLAGLAQLYQHLQDPDKNKRDMAQMYLLQNPDAYQKLVDSHMADNPGVLQQALGQNARWGGNSNASTNLANAISSSPLSPQEQAVRQNDVDNTSLGDISNVGVKLPQMRAFNGMSTNQLRQQTPELIDSITSGSGQQPVRDSDGILLKLDSKKKSSLSDNQKELLAKAQGIEGPAAQNTRKLEDLSRSAQIVSATNQAKESQSRSDLLNQQNTELTDKTNLESNATKTVDDFRAVAPKLFTGRLSTLMNNPNVPDQVRTALLNSPKYSDKTKADLLLDSQEAQRELEKQRIKDDKQYRDEWFPKMIQSQAIQAVLNYNQGTVEGFKAYFSDQKTPEAQQAKEIIGGTSTKQKLNEQNNYNTKLQDLQKLEASGKLRPEEIATSIASLNLQAKTLRAMGIDQPDLTYGESTSKTLGTRMHDALPFTQTTKSIQQAPSDTSSNNPQSKIKPDTTKKSIQTTTGDKPPMAKYDPNLDTGLKARKAAIGQRLLNENPNISAAEMKARIDSEINRDPTRPIR